MERKETFDLLRTCIIGESFRACGVGYDPEDALETYHASEFLDNVDADDITGGFASPESFLESLCSCNAGRVYETIRDMERCWESGKVGASKIMSILWDLGNAEAERYVDENFGDEASREFLEYGQEVFEK